MLTMFFLGLNWLPSLWPYMTQIQAYLNFVKTNILTKFHWNWVKTVASNFENAEVGHWVKVKVIKSQISIQQRKLYKWSKSEVHSFKLEK